MIRGGTESARIHHDELIVGQNMLRRKHQGLTHVRKVSLSGAVKEHARLTRVHVVQATCLYKESLTNRDSGKCDGPYGP